MGGEEEEREGGEVSGEKREKRREWNEISFRFLPFFFYDSNPLHFSILLHVPPLFLSWKSREERKNEGGKSREEEGERGRGRGGKGREEDGERGREEKRKRERERGSELKKVIGREGKGENGRARATETETDRQTEEIKK